MPACIELADIGGAFLQPVRQLTVSDSMNFGQMYQGVNMLQSLNRLQKLKFQGVSTIFGKVSDALVRFNNLGFTNPMLNNAQGLLTGLQSVGGYTGGLMGFLQTTDLTALIGGSGTTFITGMRDLLGTGYNANIQGLNFLNDAFQFIGFALNNSDGVDIDTTLPFPPSHQGGLRNFGFLDPVIQFYGDGPGIENLLHSLDILFKELKGHAFMYRFGNLVTNPELVLFQQLIVEMNAATLLAREDIIGDQGVVSLTNMLEILQTFGR